MDTNNQVALPAARKTISATLSFYKIHYKIIVGISAIGLILPFIAAIFGPSPLISSLLSLISALVGIFVGIVLLKVITQEGMTSGGLLNTFKEAKSLFVGYVGTTLALSITSFGGSVLFLIPGIIVSILLSLTLPIYFIEKKTGFSALTASWLYVKGLSSKIFTKYIVLGLLVLGASLILGFLLGLIGITGGTSFWSIYSSKLGTGSGEANLLGTLISIVWQTLVLAPLNLIFTFNLYKEVKAVKTTPFTPEEEQSTRKKVLTFFWVGIVGAILLAIAAITILLTIAKG